MVAAHGQVPSTPIASLARPCRCGLGAPRPPAHHPRPPHPARRPWRPPPLRVGLLPRAPASPPPPPGGASLAARRPRAPRLRSSHDPPRHYSLPPPEATTPSAPGSTSQSAAVLGLLAVGLRSRRLHSSSLASHPLSLPPLARVVVVAASSLVPPGCRLTRRVISGHTSAPPRRLPAVPTPLRSGEGRLCSRAARWQATRPFFAPEGGQRAAALSVSDMRAGSAVSLVPLSRKARR